MYNAIKKILEENGRCLLIEDGKPIGVILTMNEYEALENKSETEKTLFSEINDKPAEASAKTEASAEISDIEAVDDVTLEDLGIDELPY